MTSEQSKPWQSYGPTRLIPADENELRNAARKKVGEAGLRVHIRKWQRGQKLAAAKEELTANTRHLAELRGERRNSEDREQRRKLSDKIRSCERESGYARDDVEDFTKLIAEDAKELAQCEIEQAVIDRRVLFDKFVQHADIDLRKVVVFDWEQEDGQLADDLLAGEVVSFFPNGVLANASYAPDVRRRHINMEWHRITARTSASGEDHSSFPLAEFDKSRQVAGVGGPGVERYGNVATITPLHEIRAAWWATQEEPALRKAMAIRLKLATLPKAEGRQSPNEPLPQLPLKQRIADHAAREPKVLGSAEHEAWIREGLELHGMDVDAPRFSSAPPPLAIDQQQSDIMVQVSHFDHPIERKPRAPQPELPPADGSDLKRQLAAAEADVPISDAELKALRNPSGGHKVGIAEATAIARSQAAKPVI